MKIFGPLEELNRSLQASSYTVSGMIQAVDAVKSQLLLLRTEEAFAELFSAVAVLSEHHQLDPVVLPRQRRPPSRYTGNAPAHRSETPEDHYRAAFFMAIDTAVRQLSDRFDHSKPALQTYLALEKMLMSGNVDAKLCQQYPELTKTSLDVQLPMFHSTYNFETLAEAQVLFQNMTVEVRRLFPGVEKLIRLLLICPVSSCAAERSFSALRRLKNWMRSTMTQERLNAVCVCHVNKDILDGLDLTELAVQFSTRSTIRENIFGNFTV